MVSYEIIDEPRDKDIEFLTTKINEEATEYGSAYPFAILVRSEEQQVIGGCNGSFVFGSIYTDQLWVEDSFRRRGIGSKLMEEVHKLGKKKGCTIASVVTMSFQAPEFYKKLGYQIDFVREGYREGAACLHMSKKI